MSHLLGGPPHNCRPLPMVPVRPVGPLPAKVGGSPVTAPRSPNAPTVPHSTLIGSVGSHSPLPGSVGHPHSPLPGVCGVPQHPLPGVCGSPVVVGYQWFGTCSQTRTGDHPVTSRVLYQLVWEGFHINEARLNSILNPIMSDTLPTELSRRGGRRLLVTFRCC